MRLPLILLLIFTTLLLAGSWIQYDLLANGDCSYMQTEDCRAKLEYVPQIIFWRAISFELAALLVFLHYRKR